MNLVDAPGLPELESLGVGSTKGSCIRYPISPRPRKQRLDPPAVELGGTNDGGKAQARLVYGCYKPMPCRMEEEHWYPWIFYPTIAQKSEK